MKQSKSSENVIREIPVDPESPKTIQFKRYVIEKALENQPFRPGELIRIRIKEGETPFPKFQENVFYEDHNRWPPDVIAELDNNSFEKALSLMSYLSDQFKMALTSDEPQVEQNSPLAFYIPLVVGNPSEIYKIARDLGIDKKLFTDYPNVHKKSPPEFLEDSSEISWNGIKIPIPEDTDESDFCKFVLGLKPREKVSWDIIFEEIEGMPPKDKDKGWHKIYNTMRRVNLKVKDETNRDLFFIDNTKIYWSE